MEKPTVIEDLATILDYMYKDEIRDFVEHFDRGETDVELTSKEMEDFVEQVRHGGHEAYAELAAERSKHIVGSILRVGRQLCGWT